MTSFDNGFETAKLELESWYPAYYHAIGDGDYIYAIDRESGLPIRLLGDCGVDQEWMCGFNRAVKAHVTEHGLPWNSRLSSLNILADLPAYFRQHAHQAARLQLEGSPFTPPGFEYSLCLERKQADLCVKIEAKTLFVPPRTSRGGLIGFRMNPLPPSMPYISLKFGRELVSLRWFSQATCIEYVPAPANSHLVVFRFSQFAPSPWQHDNIREDFATLEDFAALDTQLADWILGRVSEAQLQLYA